MLLHFWVPSLGRKPGEGKVLKVTRGPWCGCSTLASSVSAPTLPESLPVGEKRGVHTSDLPVRINVAREKDGPLILTVQESELEPRGPVPWT